jgi:hypothetical protein
MGGKKPWQVRSMMSTLTRREVMSVIESMSKRKQLRRTLAIMKKMKKRR